MSTTPYAERARRLSKKADEKNEISLDSDVSGAASTVASRSTQYEKNERNELSPSVASAEPVPALDTSLSSDGEAPDAPADDPFASVPEPAMWDMARTVAYIAALSVEKRAVYRAALAFDTEALQRADGTTATDNPINRCNTTIRGPQPAHPLAALLSRSWDDFDDEGQAAQTLGQLRFDILCDPKLTAEALVALDLAAARELHDAMNEVREWLSYVGIGLYRLLEKGEPVYGVRQATEGA